MATEEEKRMIKALTQATETIRDLREKLDLAIECLEDYEGHVLFDAFPWGADEAKKILKRIR
jgi:hypothetical protein